MRLLLLCTVPRCMLPVLALVAFATLCNTSSAWAQAAPPTRVQPAPDDAQRAKQVEAEQLFLRAAARIDIKDYEVASTLLERSQALDPSSGTLLNLGECYEQRGLTASAYAAFSAARELAVQTGRTDRAEVAEVRVKRLLPTLRRLTIISPSHAPPSLVIKLDGKPVERDKWNQPVPIDPGVHHLEATADAQPAYDTRVPAPEPGAVATVSIPPWTSAPGSMPMSERGIDGQRVAAIASGIAGVAGLATGTVFGLRSQSKHRESDEHCGPTGCRDAEGVALMDNARSAGNVSTVSFVVGGVACAAAAVLWFAPPFGKGKATQIGLGPGAIRVAAQW